MGQNCKPYMVLWYLLSIHSLSNPNADILVTSLVLKHCAHALRQPWGSHHKWNEALYRFARRRPQLTRGPTACGHRRFEHLASCVYAARPLRSWLPATAHVTAQSRLDTFCAQCQCLHRQLCIRGGAHRQLCIRGGARWPLN
jgi:hypothetical protein